MEDDHPSADGMTTNPQPRRMARPKAIFFHVHHGITEVKQGFSWPAFFFGALWAAAKRMWLPEFFLLLLVDVGLWFLTGLAEARNEDGLALIGAVASLAYAIIRGRYGNRWLASSLVRRGYLLQRHEHAGI